MTFIRAKHRGDRTYYYLVEGHREDGKIRQKVVQYLGTAESLAERLAHPAEPLSVVAALDYGPVAVLHALASAIGLRELVDRHTAKGGGPRLGALFELMVVNRCLDPTSRHKLPRWYARTSLPALLELPVERVSDQVLYNALGYFDDARVLAIQQDLLKVLRTKYKIDVSRVLYDTTSAYFEGVLCPLAEHGYSRDHRPDRRQINLAVAVTADGIPITHEVLRGNVTDVTTVQSFADRLKAHFHLDRPVVVADRGMVSQENLNHLRREGFDYVVALPMNEREKRFLRRQTQKGYVKAFPDDERQYVCEGRRGGRRWIAVYNKDKAQDDRRWREEAIAASEEKLRVLASRKGKRRVRTKEELLEGAEGILKRHKAQAFLRVLCGERGLPRLRWEKDREAITRARRLDGKSLIETTVDWPVEEVLRAYRGRDAVERFMRAIKSVVELRPIYVHKEVHVKAHVFVCVTAVLLIALLERVLRKAGRKMTGVEALERLEGVQEVLMAQAGELKRVLTPASAEQRELLLMVGVVPR